VNLCSMLLVGLLVGVLLTFTSTLVWLEFLVSGGQDVGVTLLCVLCVCVCVCPIKGALLFHPTDKDGIIVC
jgi:hypothetical protein